ncbi:HNH endonuclease, partial [Rhodococcus sp. CX]|nr:HNH endonuclease [Rhodococcus sp. CX]
MLSNSVEGEVVGTRLAALDAAVDGLLEDDLTGLSNDDLVEFLQRFETVLRRATAVGHRAIVEAVERRVPEDLG